MESARVRHDESQFSRAEIEREARRLHEDLDHVEWDYAECELIAPMTLEIEQLKKEQDAVILAHSYQTPDIIYGIADHSGDSLGLSREAAETDASTIVFCGVEFMAETAKVLSPDKRVLLPSRKAGCSLADSITAQDVRDLKEEYPGVPVVCYVNTGADIKAESDACCTSSNALQVIEAMEGDRVIFIPDELMAENLAPLTEKELITWDGTCVVHENFMEESMEYYKDKFPDLEVLAHTECDPAVVGQADQAGSTSSMINHVEQNGPGVFMLVTECGLSERMRVEFPESKFIGSCVLCPYMKKITMKNTLEALKDPRDEQIIDLDDDVIREAQKSLDRMMEIGRGGSVKGG